MVRICQTRLLKLNFEIIPKKRIFRFLPKISAGHAWIWKKIFANFQILGPLGCQGWVVIPQNVKKSQNHCTLMYYFMTINFWLWLRLQRSWPRSAKSVTLFFLLRPCLPRFKPSASDFLLWKLKFRGVLSLAPIWASEFFPGCLS